MNPGAIYMPSGGERIWAEQEGSEVSPRKFTVIAWKTNTERGARMSR